MPTRFLTAVFVLWASAAVAADWPQLQGNALRSGDAPGEVLQLPLGLVASAPLTDGIYAAPVVAGGRVFVIDGSGVVVAFDAATLKEAWRFATRGGPGNCNNVAAPAAIGKYLHLGTTAGYYYVLDQATGKVVNEIDCKEPIFSAPAAGQDRVYFATLGARVYAVEPNGKPVWNWDFVKEVVKFNGNRWNGMDWLKERGDRVNWKDHFVCSRDICLLGKTVVMPAGGRTVFLDDVGDAAKLAAVGEIPGYDGNEFPATFGQSADAAGNVYVQWHRRDNAGRVEILKLGRSAASGGPSKVDSDYVRGTETAIHLPGLLSFAAVAVRGGDVYRVKPEQGLGLVRHSNEPHSAADLAITSSANVKPDLKPNVLDPSPSICPPVLTKDHVIYGGLDGKVHINPLAGGEALALATAFAAPITAPVAVADGRVYVACEDGYLYAFGKSGKAPLPTKDLEVWKVRSPITGPLADSKYNWYTNYGNFAGTNANEQGLAPPLRMRWARRLEGTVKHLPVCGGGRMYTHTAEGLVIAVEQDTGRLLWRRYSPHVYLSFTSPLYVNEKLLVPQAGIKQSRMRCLDAATGKQIWEAPFTGSPSWSRQFPPVVHGKVAIYASGSGEYAPQGTEKPYTFKGTPLPAEGGKEVMAFIYSNDNPYYPKDNRPLLWAWDLDTGKVVWEKDFSDQGRGGNDCGLCLLDGKLYYSTFFGFSASQRARRGLPVENNGLTACLDPATGDVIWQTNKYHVTAKCTLSAKDGRLYIGGYNPAREDTKDRFVWCLDAKDGSLIWQSDVVTSALNVVTIGDRFIFSNALRGRGNVFDKETGKVVGGVDHNYACCRFTMSGTYVLGANMDMIDLASGGKLVSTGPAIDSRECLGAVVSNGRVFYTSQASGFVVSQTFGEASRNLPAVWDR